MIAVMVAAIIVAALIAAVCVVFVVQRWSWRGVTHRRVFVQTDAGVSFDGVLMSRRGRLLYLADVTVRAPDSARADGLVVVERSRVLWIQVAN